MALGPQFEQLKMFMSPAEVKDHVTTSGDLHYQRTPGGGLRNETMNELWDRKLEASKAPRDSGHGSGVYEGLEAGKDIMYMRRGNTVDVNYVGDHKFLGDMHHRIAAMADIDQQRGTQTYLPVEHWGHRFSQAREPGAKAKTSEVLGSWQIEEAPYGPTNPAHNRVLEHFK